VKTRVLAKVIEYCKHYVGAEVPPIAKPLKSANLADFLPAWDVKFVEVEQELLFEMILVRARARARRGGGGGVRGWMRRARGGGCCGRGCV
jgi:hypothetical protein